MKPIPLSQGKTAFVDDEDFERLAAYKWSAAKRGKPPNIRFYAVRRELGIIILMHHLILPPKAGLDTDHRDHNGLNNTRHNLRRGTRSQNNMNARIRRDNSSGYRGVSFSKAANKWWAKINKDGNHHSGGYFSDPVEAARSYDRLALTLFGEFARLNFPFSESA